jgi:4-aminobutyrate aminotransferase-like enzyme
VHAHDVERVVEAELVLDPDGVAADSAAQGGGLAVAVPFHQEPAAGGAEPEDLLRRRRRVTGGPLSPLFYSRPLHIVRGEGPWLSAADGTVLKVRPPLIWHPDHADLFCAAVADALDRL